MSKVIVDGVEWQEFLIEFQTQEGTFNFKLFAVDWAHAIDRLEELKATAKVVGDNCSEVPAAPVQVPVACGHCNGLGRMVRDPDIGTDQECFVCNGFGFNPTFERKKMTEQQLAAMQLDIREWLATKHIVCYSGGHSSALVALEVAKRYGTENMVLLNHDMHHSVEHQDIKRFKQEVSEYLGVPLTFANRRNAKQDQFDVCVESSAFKVNNGQELCTSRLKTEPFMQWLAENVPNKNAVIYYGFDANEQHRIQRRSGIMGAQGWRTDFPLIWKERTIFSTDEIGIPRPSTYSVFKHGNCIGCLKAGWQHWYIVYCTRPDIWEKAKWAEEEIGHAIHHDNTGPVYLETMEARFSAMKAANVPATEHIPHQKFWANAKKVIAIKPQMELSLPCECTEQ